MGNLKHTDKAASEMVRKFCTYFADLKAMLLIYEELFENDKAKLLMEKTAKSFFYDINLIIVKALLLEFAKITDLAYSNTKEGKRENFTVENLVDTIDWPDRVKVRLEKLKDETKVFHSLIETARNKLLAHYDKESFLTNKVLGCFDRKDGVKFIETLQEICDITHQVCFDSILGDIVIAEPGDVLALKKTLRKALVYDRLFQEGDTKERFKLLNYRKELE